MQKNTERVSRVGGRGEAILVEKTRGAGIGILGTGSLKGGKKELLRLAGEKTKKRQWEMGRT